MERALVTGAFGQDGSYLVELLAEEGYEVHALIRLPLSPHSLRLRDNLKAKGVVVQCHVVDMLGSFEEVSGLFEALRPALVFHLAAAHHSAQIKTSAEDGHKLYMANVAATANLLAGIKSGAPSARFVGAGSCLMFDATQVSPQSHLTPFRSRSPYGVSKIAAADLTRLYRESSGVHASTAILYNHESPRRAESFVTKKVVKGLCAAKRGLPAPLVLGSTAAIKDWGHAREYVRALYLMSKAANPLDLVIATGQAATVADFVRAVAEELELRDLERLINIDENVASSNIANCPLIGDPAPAEKHLGWRAETTYRKLAAEMVKHEMDGTLD